MAESMRIFIGIPLSDEIREKLASVVEEIKGRGINKVKPENLHITLKFIGEVDEKTLNELIESLKTTTFTPFNVEIRGIGAFPSLNYIRVLWAGVDDRDEKLTALANAVIEKTKQLGDKKPFHPHITLCRVKSKNDSIFDVIRKYVNKSFGNMVVDKFVVFKSTLTSKGPVYEKIEEIKALT